MTVGKISTVPLVKCYNGYFYSIKKSNLAFPLFIEGTGKVGFASNDYPLRLPLTQGEG